VELGLKIKCKFMSVLTSKKCQLFLGRDITKQANIRKTEFTISGMTCTACEEHVNHELNKLSGIINTTVSYETGNAIVEFDKTKTNIQEIEKAISNTGYSVTYKKEIK
jgi:copper chaperone CopZ